MEPDLVVKRDRGIATILINRPEVHNVLTGEMYRDLAQHLYDLDQDDAVSVIVVRGAGEKAFCAGTDVKYITNKTVQERQKFFGCVAELMQAPVKMGKPVIAAIKGYAFGGGCAFAAACDLSIATENSKMGIPEMELGIFPATIVPVIVRRLGVAKAFELIMMGERIDGRKAADLGLINKAVPEGEFEGEVSKWATSLSAKSPLAVKMGKIAFYNSLDVEYTKAIRFMGNMVAINASYDDVTEGIAAFFEKRRPQWKGR